jgi:hypothetical protein
MSLPPITQPLYPGQIRNQLAVQIQRTFGRACFGIELQRGQ